MNDTLLRLFVSSWNGVPVASLFVIAVGGLIDAAYPCPPGRRLRAAPSPFVDLAGLLGSALEGASDPRRAGADLQTHLTDITKVLAFEELEQVVLVGHSYGGMVITGVADRAPQRVLRLIYLDGLVPHDGESAIELVGPQVRPGSSVRSGQTGTAG